MYEHFNVFRNKLYNAINRCADEVFREDKLLEAYEYFVPVPLETINTYLTKPVTVEDLKSVYAFVINNADMEHPMLVVLPLTETVSPKTQELIFLHEFAHMYTEVVGAVLGDHDVIWEATFKKLNDIYEEPFETKRINRLLIGTIEDIPYGFGKNSVRRFYCPVCKDIFQTSPQRFKLEHSHQE